MNLTALLQFLPLIIGAFLAYHFIIKKELPAKNLGGILTYFVGILIVLLAVGWFIRSYMPNWANGLLNTGTSSAQWQQFIQNSEGVINNAFQQQGTSVQPTIPPVQQPVYVTPVPVPSTGTGNTAAGGTTTTGPVQYEVKAGDTLTSIAQRFNVTVSDIMAVNPLTSADYIKAGDILYIPAPKQ